MSDLRFFKTSVNDFLWFIKNASYVVTNSFHGLIFSMIFEKEFFWNYQQGKSMSNNRFDMLSKQYGIDIRCFSENKKLKDYEQLDYNMIKCYNYYMYRSLYTGHGPNPFT